MRWGSVKRTSLTGDGEDLLDGRLRGKVHVVRVAAGNRFHLGLARNDQVERETQCVLDGLSTHDEAVVAEDHNVTLAEVTDEEGSLGFVD